MEIDLLIILDEYNASYRQIFLDGRALPSERTPTWNGYATAHWDGDTRVVESTGYRDHQRRTRTERIRRPNFGSLVIDLSVDDPKAYTHPLKPSVRKTKKMCSHLEAAR
jgi:predicted aminopeptidase